MKLRDYQQDTINAIWQAVREGCHAPLAVLPTGAGKSPVVAQLCIDAVHKWKGRALVVVHTKELVDQLYRTTSTMWPDEYPPIGIMSAGLGKVEVEDVTIAGIQTAYTRGVMLGRRDIMIVDECFTAGTLISTPRGNMPIELIQPGDMVLSAVGPCRVAARSVTPAMETVYVKFNDGTGVECTPGHKFFTFNGWVEAWDLEGKGIINSERVRSLWEDLYPIQKEDLSIDEREAIQQAEFLLSLLREECDQSYVQRRIQKKDEGKTARNRAPPENTRREWEGTICGAEGNVRSLGGGLGNGVYTQDGAEAHRRIPSSFQNRFGKQGINDSDRIRRILSLFTYKEKAGLKKGYTPSATWVESVTVKKRGCPCPVFNLQVEGHPSYYANGALVHNCQMIPQDGDGMYRQLINDLRIINPAMRVIGLTATPYRTTTGRVDGEDGFFEKTVIDVSILELIEKGYLSNITGKNGGNPDISGVHKRGGEFIQQELEASMADAEKVAAACDEIKKYIPGREGTLVFCCGTRHCDMVAEALRERGVPCEVVTADTPAAQRDRSIEAFKNRELRCLVNTNILSIGFDAPHVDLIVMLRPTESPGLYYQQVGRGFRICPGKDSCTVLDLAGNMERHGPITMLNDRVSNKNKGKGDGEAPAKTCPECSEIVHCSVMVCPSCGHAFPPRVIAKHGTEAADGDPLRGSKSWHDVGDCEYSAWPGKDGKPDTLRVDYYPPGVGGRRIASEWVCIQHPSGSYAHTKAMLWLQERLSFPVVNRMIITPDGEMPCTPATLVDEGLCRYIKVPSRIETKPDGAYTKITNYEWSLDDDDLPF